jgi:uncharacterized protein YndB with AHSA1/START domain
MAARKIEVEVLIPAPVSLVWERTQNPEQHVKWDIRFTTIRNAEEVDAQGFHLLDYRTRIGLGVEIVGTGRYLQSVPLRHSTFGFDSADWKSIIKNGRGIWQYTPQENATLFRTVYDYDARGGVVGRLIDRMLFRPLLRYATEWGFETLRRWCAGDEQACARRRSVWRFLGFFLTRALGRSPPPGAARSWLSDGKSSALAE